MKKEIRTVVYDEELRIEAYRLEGAILLFDPGDDHACVQSDGGTLDYRGINIEEPVMLDLAEEVTGKREFPSFSEKVVYDRKVWSARVFCGRRGSGRRRSS